MPRPPQGQPIVAALAHQPVPFEFAATSADVVFITPADTADVPRWIGDVRGAETAVGRDGSAAAAVRRPRRVPRRHPRRRRRPARPSSTTSPASSSVRTAPCSSARPRSWSTSCWPGATCGFDGFRLRPGGDGPRPRRHRRRRRAGTAAARRVPRRLRAGVAASAARPVPPRQPLRQERMSMPTTTAKPRKQIILGAHFPGVNNTTRVERPGSREPGRVRLVRPPRPDRRAGQVRLLLPRRGSAPARAAGQDPRPRRRRPPRHADDPRRAGRRDDPPRAGRHAQRHVPRGLRAGPPAGHARPPVGRAGGVERGHLVGRVHRRELPARRVPRLRRPLRAGRGVHPDRSRAVGLVGRGRDRRRRRRRAVRAVRAAGSVRAPRRAVRHPRQLHRAAQPAAPPRDPPGRRQRRRARAGRGDVRRHLQPPLPAGRRAGLLRRHQVAGSPSTAARPTSSRSSRPRRTCWATRPTTPPRRRMPSAASRSARRRRSCCSSSCGTGTCRPTTPRARCPRSTPTCRRRRSSRAGPGCTPIR